MSLDYLNEQLTKLNSIPDDHKTNYDIGLIHEIEAIIDHLTSEGSK